MVIIIQGSVKDRDWSDSIAKYLDKFSVNYKIFTASAHKTPEFLLSILKKYEFQNEPVIYICVAGRSNALGGFVDANVTSPVINCPPKSNSYAGLDILSSLRMPGGVSAFTVLEPEQAALAAVKILSVSDQKLKNKIKKYQLNFKKEIIKSNNT